MQALYLLQLCFLPGWTVESRNVHENNFRHWVLASQLWINQLCQLLSKCFIVLLASRILPYFCGLKIQLLNLLTGEGRGREHKRTNINIEPMLKQKGRQDYPCTRVQIQIVLVQRLDRPMSMELETAEAPFPVRAVSDGGKVGHKALCFGPTDRPPEGTFAMKRSRAIEKRGHQLSWE